MERKFLFNLIRFTRGSLIGLLTGILITLFAKVIALGSELNYKYPYLILALPVGALLTQFIYQKLGSFYKNGTVDAIDEINHESLDEKEKNLATSQIPKTINPILILINFITTFFTHLFGASGGKEGAGVQIGLCSSTLFYKFEQRLYNSKVSFSYYLMCGAAAAFSALFSAPIAGVFFGTQFASPNTSRLDAYLSCIPSSFFAVFISKALHIHTLTFNTSNTLPIGINSFLLVVAFSILIGILSIFTTRAMHFSKIRFEKICKNQYLKVLYPAIILMIINLILLMTTSNPDYQGMGVPLFEKVMANEKNYYSFLIKLVLVCLTYAASFTGGEVVPLLIIGALYGSTFASIFALDGQIFATLGAVALLSGGTNLPLVCFALGFELFKYNEPTLLFVSVAIAFVFSGTEGIYKHQAKPY